MGIYFGRKVPFAIQKKGGEAYFREIMVLVTMPGTAIRIRAPNSLIL